MRSQSIKDVYFLVNRFACLPNTALARVRFRKPRYPEGHYLHFGCGDTYLDGMVNIDGNIRQRSDLWLDLRNRLPFANESTAVIYCSHTIEHLFPYEAQSLLCEFRRILSPKGMARIAVPSFHHALSILDGKWQSRWPRKYSDLSSQMINYLFCDGQHKYAYCFPLLKQFAEEAGFARVTDYSAAHGILPKSYGRVTLGNEPAGSLVVELQR